MLGTKPSSSEVGAAGEAFFKTLLGPNPPDGFAIEFWDAAGGRTWDPYPDTPTRVRLKLNHPGSVRNMFSPFNINALTEAYLYDDFDIIGDIVGFCELGDFMEDRFNSMSIRQKLGLGWQLWNLPKVPQQRTGRRVARLEGAQHSQNRDKQAVSFHYDISNKFFELFLDRHMVYTCALFENDAEDVDTAQERRFAKTCRKLRLKPGDKLLDIGCGWGGLVMHAAKYYPGIHATGVTLSKNQAEWANDAIKKAGLQDRCEVKLMDYRNINDGGCGTRWKQYDKISTIEVTEHFGAKQFPTYFKKCWDLLVPEGLLLIQQISLADPAFMRRPTLEFSLKYIFPDGELLPANFTQKKAEDAGFETRSVESFREHYALTLDRWLNTFEANHDELVLATDEPTYRAFRLYLAGAKHLFQSSNKFNLHQMLFSKPDQNAASGLPLNGD